MARQKTSLGANVRVEGADETIRKFKQLSKDAKNEIKERTKKLAETLAGKARSAGMSDFAPQSKLVAPTVRAVKGTSPSIVVGGSKKVGKRGTPAYKVLFGSEFGSNTYTQFGRPHSGREGNWFFPVVEDNKRDVVKAWDDIVDEVADEFTQGGRL